jgi:hypothetical protein
MVVDTLQRPADGGWHVKRSDFDESILPALESPAGPVNVTETISNNKTAPSFLGAVFLPRARTIIIINQTLSDDELLPPHFGNFQSKLPQHFQVLIELVEKIWDLGLN